MFKSIRGRGGEKKAEGEEEEGEEEEAGGRRNEKKSKGDEVRNLKRIRTGIALHVCML